MKVKSFLAMAFAAMLAVGTVGCSDDNDSNSNKSQGVKEVKVSSTNDSKWVYVNFETGESVEVSDRNEIKYIDVETGNVIETATPDPSKLEGEIPAKWDIAMNGFNIRTNNGGVLLTDKTDFSALLEAPAGEYVQDKAVKAEDKVIRVDMSRMQEGIMGYVDGFINEVLCNNIKKTPTGAMPPYEYSVENPNNVFVLRLANGDWVKIKYTDCTYGGGKKSIFLSYEYMNK